MSNPNTPHENLVDRPTVDDTTKDTVDDVKNVAHPTAQPNVGKPATVQPTDGWCNCQPPLCDPKCEFASAFQAQNVNLLF